MRSNVIELKLIQAKKSQHAIVEEDLDEIKAVIPSKKRVEQIISDLSEKIIKRTVHSYLKTNVNGIKRIQGQLLFELSKICETQINKHCEVILEAAKVKPGEIQKIIKLAKLINRRQMAGDLLGARKRLQDIKKEHIANENKLKEKLEEVRIAIESKNIIDSSDCKYPPAPFPTIVPSLDGIGLPAASGIYFLWDRGAKVEYVGKSISISSRVRLGKNGYATGHHRLRDSDYISYVLLPEDELLYAECFYISKYRPTRNGGTPCH